MKNGSVKTSISAAIKYPVRPHSPAPRLPARDSHNHGCPVRSWGLSCPTHASGVCDLTCPIALARPCPAVLPDGQDRCAAARASRPHSASLCVGARALGARAHATAAVPPSLSVHCARIETVSQDRDQNANGGVTVRERERERERELY